jgi:hypothetical protein
LFDFERGINGLAAEQRLCVRKEQGAASDGSRLLRSASVAEPIDSMLKRWDRFARFIGGRRIRLSNMPLNARRHRSKCGAEPPAGGAQDSGQTWTKARWTSTHGHDATHEEAVTGS